MVKTNAISLSFIEKIAQVDHQCSMKATQQVDDQLVAFTSQSLIT